MRIVLDANIYLSAIGFKSKMLQEFILMCFESFEVVRCEELVEEIRYNLDKKCKAQDLEWQIFDLMIESGKNFKLTSHEYYARDPKDGYLLTLSEISKASFLITGDNDLLDLKSFKQTKILKARDFVDLISQQQMP